MNDTSILIQSLSRRRHIKNRKKKWGAIWLFSHHKDDVAHNHNKIYLLASQCLSHHSIPFRYCYATRSISSNFHYFLLLMLMANDEGKRWRQTMKSNLKFLCVQRRWVCRQWIHRFKTSDETMTKNVNGTHCMMRRKIKSKAQTIYRTRIRPKNIVRFMCCELNLWWRFTWRYCDASCHTVADWSLRRFKRNGKQRIRNRNWGELWKENKCSRHKIDFVITIMGNR